MKPNIYPIAGIIFLMLTWLFTGLFRDDEFNEPIIFCKYRPTFKVYFYSPTGQSDLTIKDLSIDKQYQENAFQEFVIKQKLQSNSSSLRWNLPPILIQLTLPFITFGLLKIGISYGFKKWQLPVHFFINLGLTTLVIALILVYDKIVWTVLLILLIFIINYVTALLLTKRKKNQVSKSI